jgi:hypothetical protein
MLAARVCALGGRELIPHPHPRPLSLRARGGVLSENVFPRGDQEAGRAARRVEQAFVLLRVDQLDHEVDDVARGAELAGVALAAEHGEQVFEGVAEALGVVVGEAVDFLEEGAQRFRVAVGQVGVLEDVAEERGDAGVFVHPADGVGVEVELFLAGEFGRLEPRPAVAGRSRRQRSCARRRGLRPRGPCRP